MDSITNILKRLRESRLSEAGIISVSIDEDKFYNAMKNEGYYEGEEFEFIQDIYGLEDGEDFQVGNGFDFLFYSDTGKDESIEKFKKELGESIKESADTISMEFADETDAEEWAEANGYKIDKIQNGKREKSCVCWMTKIEESSGREYISVEYTYNGDETSDYLGHVKVRTDKEDVALKAAEKYAMSKHPEDDPRHFNISKDNYTNVDVVDSDGDYLTIIEESDAPHGSLESNVVEMYLNGDSVTEIASNLSITRADVQVIIDDYMSSRKKDINDSKEIDDATVQQIRGELQYALHKFMTSPRIGFLEDEVDKYSAVDVEILKDNEYGNNLRLEVRAELGYTALSDLGEELTKVVDTYEEGTYFEPEQPGILVAYLNM